KRAYTYDGAGNVRQVSDSLGGTTVSGYNADNQLTSRIFGGPGPVHVEVDLGYDADGRVTDMSWSTQPLVVVSSHTNYDGAGVVQKIHQTVVQTQVAGTS